MTGAGVQGKNKCPLKAPSDQEFGEICHPGATGHAGGAEQPVYRCPRSNYTEGVFRCVRSPPCRCRSSSSRRRRRRRGGALASPAPAGRLCPLLTAVRGCGQACCGAPLFYAKAKFQPQGDGWPAFHGATANVNNTVCTPVSSPRLTFQPPLRS